MSSVITGKVRLRVSCSWFTNWRLDWGNNSRLLMQRMRYTRITFKWFLSKKISLDFLLYSHVPSCLNTILRGTRTKRVRWTLRTNEVVLDCFLPWMEVWWTCLKYLRFLRNIHGLVTEKLVFIRSKHDMFGGQTSELSFKKNLDTTSFPPPLPLIYFLYSHHLSAWYFKGLNNRSANFHAKVWNSTESIRCFQK